VHIRNCTLEFSGKRWQGVGGWGAGMNVRNKSVLGVFKNNRHVQKCKKRQKTFFTPFWRVKIFFEKILILLPTNII